VLPSRNRRGDIAPKGEIGRFIRPSHQPGQAAFDSLAGTGRENGRLLDRHRTGLAQQKRNLRGMRLEFERRTIIAVEQLDRGRPQTRRRRRRALMRTVLCLPDMDKFVKYDAGDEVDDRGATCRRAAKSD
jgi:hypothetical protein